jgi:hypothetical protein
VKPEKNRLNFRRLLRLCASMGVAVLTQKNSVQNAFLLERPKSTPWMRFLIFYFRAQDQADLETSIGDNEIKLCRM